MLTPAMSSHMSQGARASCLQVSMELVGGTSLSTHDARAMDGSQSLWVPRSQAGHTALPPLTPLFPRHHLSPGRCGAVRQTSTPGGAIPALWPQPCRALSQANSCSGALPPRQQLPCPSCRSGAAVVHPRPHASFCRPRPLRAGTGPCSGSGCWTGDAPTPGPLPVSVRQPVTCLAVPSHWVLTVLLLPWEVPPGGTVWGEETCGGPGTDWRWGQPRAPSWGWETVVQRAVETWTWAQACSRVAAGSEGSGHGGQGTAWASRGTLRVAKLSPLPTACGRATRRPRLEAGQCWSH